MALEIGVDSYVTLEEAENYISSNYLSDNELVEKWSSLSDRDKEALLRASCIAINNLKFDGRRANLGQKLEFPRVLAYPVGLGYNLYISQFVDNGLVEGGLYGDGGLQLAKYAQIENALYHCFLDKVVSNQLEINIKGLVSKKAGPISETYNANNKYNKDILRGIYTEKVYSLLAPWLSDARANV